MSSLASQRLHIKFHTIRQEQRRATETVVAGAAPTRAVLSAESWRMLRDHIGAGIASGRMTHPYWKDHLARVEVELLAAVRQQEPR